MHGMKKHNDIEVNPVENGLNYNASRSVMFLLMHTVVLHGPTVTPSVPQPDHQSIICPAPETRSRNPKL